MKSTGFIRYQLFCLAQLEKTDSSSCRELLINIFGQEQGAELWAMLDLQNIESWYLGLAETSQNRLLNHSFFAS